MSKITLEVTKVKAYPMKNPLHLIALLAVVLAGFYFCWPTPKLLAQADRQVRGQGPRNTAPAGDAEQRVALVIGNAAYAEGTLANPVNDARDMAKTLRQLGFDVSSGENCDRRQMEDLIRKFGR